MNLFQLIRGKMLVIYFLIFSESVFSQKRIAIIGSSSAYGYFPTSCGYPKDSAWSYKIKKYYKDLGVIDTLFNLAQSSTDCFEGMPSSYIPPAGFGYRLPNPNINITRAVNLIPKPDVIIVNYPSNNYDWISIEQVLTCLQTIKDSANAKNIKCYITTTQPRDGFSPTERLKLKTLRDMILDRFGECAIDFFTLIAQEADLKIKPQYAIGDGVHLNPEGHTVLKNQVLEKNIFFGSVLLKFTEICATSHADKIVLHWKTINENYNQQFIIETSTDGIHFLPLSLIQAPEFFPRTCEYSYTHFFPATGQHYYRIVALSVQGQKEYSSITSVLFTKQSGGNVAITFSNNLINLSFKEISTQPVYLKIFTMEGKLILIKKIEINSLHIYPINISKIPSGKYIVQVLFDIHKETFQFMKL